MLRRIELINFMSHTHTVIEPSPGLTVLVGPNNCGKSALVVALQILAHNDVSTYVLRHGAREASVLVETEEGGTIEWRRPKTGGPAYLVDGVRYDRLGGDVPEPVEKSLRLRMVTPTAESRSREFDLHFGTQKSPVFLIDEPSSVVAQFFASSSDAEKLVAMQQLHRDNLRQAKSDRGRLAAEIEGLQESIATLSPAKPLVTRLEASQTLFAAITKGDELQARLHRSLSALSASRERLSLASSFADALSPLRAPPPLHDVPTMRRLISGLRTATSDQTRTIAEIAALASIKAPPSQNETPPLREHIAKLRAANEHALRCERLDTQLRALPVPPETRDLAPLRTTLANLMAARDAEAHAVGLSASAAEAFALAKREIAEWAKANQSCPTCGRSLSAEQAVAVVTGSSTVHRHEPDGARDE